MKFIATYELATLRLIDWNTQRIKTHNDKSIFNIYALELFASQYVYLLRNRRNKLWVVLLVSISIILR